MKIGYDREKSEAYGRRFGAVILAAGLSERMKSFKPLLHVDGTTAIEGLIEAAKAAGINDITVVTGHEREKLRDVISRHGVSEVYNSDYKDGMFSSVRTGIMRAVKSGKEGYLLMPADCPLISVSVMRSVMAEAGDEFAVATYEGKKGHPLYVPAKYAAEICAHDGIGGLAAVTDRYADRMVRVETGEEGCVLDMDTPEGYEDITSFVTKGFAREKLELLTARKRIFLVRHGETERHEEPVFIGQYDVPVSDKGRAEAETAGEQIARLITEDVEAERLGVDKFGKEPMPAIERIYSSDLRRAAVTADIIKEKVNDILPSPVDVKLIKGLREIDLGEWDGKTVRDVKESYPEDYERRGCDMFAFKLRGQENFYDMQYRVLAALRDILRNDDAKNIIIVTHKGVIRALENNIKGLRVDDGWTEIKKGEFRVLEPFPEQPREKVHGSKPMNMNDLTMEAVLEYYE